MVIDGENEVLVLLLAMVEFGRGEERDIDYTYWLSLLRLLWRVVVVIVSSVGGAIVNSGSGGASDGAVG